MCDNERCIGAEDLVSEYFGVPAYVENVAWLILSFGDMNDFGASIVHVLETLSGSNESILAPSVTHSFSLSLITRKRM